MKAAASFATSVVLGAIVWTVPAPAVSHFLGLIPSTDLAASIDGAPLNLEVSFMHPFEGERMDMAPPKRVGVRHAGKTQDLGSELILQKEEQHRWFDIRYRLDRPGDHVFFVEPEPYWEPAEETFIVHQTKVVVNAFGLEDAWDQPLGLKAEILPLSRPYGLWAGNLFTGRVLFKGQPAAYAEIEVTPYRGAESIGDALPVQKIQTLRADQNGVFSYAMPKAGWWGFAALLEDDRTLPGPEGRSYPVELGAVIWIRAQALD